MFPNQLLPFAVALVALGAKFPVWMAGTDDGVWPVGPLPLRVLKERYGLEPTAEWLDHVRLGSARFDTGGSGSFMSPNGRVMTNHHLSLTAIRAISTPQKGWVGSWFSSEKHSREVHGEDLTLRQLLEVRELRSRWPATPLAPSASVVAGDRQNPSPSLVPNGTFDKDGNGWVSQASRRPNTTCEWSATGGRNGSGALYLRSTSEDKSATATYSYSIRNLPAGKALKLALWIRGKDVSQASWATLQGFTENQAQMDAVASTKALLRGTFDWTQVTCTVNPTEKARECHVLLALSSKGEIWVDDLTVTPAGQSTAQSEGPGLYELRGECVCEPQEDVESARIFMPMPLAYREQVPISFALVVDPATSITSQSYTTDHAGNHVLECRLTRLKKGHRVKVEWTSLVLAANRSYVGVSGTARVPSEWPEEARLWLRPTGCAQSEDPSIQAIAKEIKQGTDSVMAIIDATIAKCREIRRTSKSGFGSGLDAVQALEYRGNCTSAANLFAALIRANGIPARILAGCPAWAGPLATHYIVEVWCPDYGWYAVETTILQKACQPHAQLQVSIVTPENEDKSEAGVPFMSITGVQCPGRVTRHEAINGEEQCDHVASRVSRFDESPEVWNEALSLARTRWFRWVGSEAAKELGAPPKLGSLKAIIAAMKG